MAVSRQGIADRALRRCGVLPFGQSADANRSAAALQAYDEVYAYLRELEIVDWTATADVPNQYVYHVVALTALNLLDDIAVPSERAARIRADAAQAEPSIRRVYVPRYKRDDVKAEDF